MDEHEFDEALREIESLPDTAGGGVGSSRHDRKERIEFAYQRRDTLEELLSKTQTSLHCVQEEIRRLTQEERDEMMRGPQLPRPRRRASDRIIGDER
jgi:hypothetical protein